MSQITRLTVACVTNASGAFSGFSPNFSGRLLAAHVIVPGSGGISGAAIALTSEATAEPLLSVSSVSSTAYYYPRTPVHTDVGVASLYASAGLPVVEAAALGDDRVAIAITSGGNTKKATIILIVEGD